MWKKLFLGLLCLSVVSIAEAHLCHNHSRGAKDSLSVKVDVRDGQLRIGEEGTFKVYLLNTMIWELKAIDIEVMTEQFSAEVQPSSDWKTFPLLQTTVKGGKREYFTVTLRRRQGIPDGKYKLTLRVFNPLNPEKHDFKAIGMSEAAAIYKLDRAQGIKIDGAASAAEWSGATLCTDFYEYLKVGYDSKNYVWPSKPRIVKGKIRKPRFWDNCPTSHQSRFRMAADQENLYYMLNFHGGTGFTSDVAAIYIAESLDAKPVVVKVDRITGRVQCEKGTAGIEIKMSGDKKVVECRIPRTLLGVKGVKKFYLNFIRTLKSAQKEIITYWRGNKFSVLDPVVYAEFNIAE